MIAIIDYGMGNIHSVAKAIALYKGEALVTNKADDIRKCQKVVLPGVGAFDDAMEELHKRKLVDAIRESIKAHKPFLGICLGMQLLFEKSEEAKRQKGLGVLVGSVRRFPDSVNKVPHIGWNQLKVKLPTCPLLQGVSDSACVYFCHSYFPDPVNKSIVASTSEYGIEFTALVWQNNVFGVQFHPEKSQEIGLRMVNNFVNIC